jgi:hypothetical protein
MYATKKLFEKLSFLKYFEEDLFKKYNLDIENNNIRLSNEIVDNINRISNTNFSSHFIVYIIFVYLSDSF